MKSSFYLTELSQAAYGRWGKRAFWLVLSLSPSLAHAQSWLLEPSVKTDLTATSNSRYTNAADARSDVIARLAPGLMIRGNGPRVKAEGTLALNAVSYLRNTQRTKVLPQGAIKVNTSLVEQFFDLETALSVEQVGRADFGVRPDAETAHNTQTTTQIRLNPVIKHAFSKDAWLEARANNTWIDPGGGASDVTQLRRRNAYLQDQSVHIEREPHPFGVTLHWERQDTRYQGQDSSALTINKAQAAVSYQVWDQLALGVLGGYEQDRVAYGSMKAGVYGVQLDWRPNERVRLNSSLQHRFFGTGWDVGFSYRAPFQAWNMQLSRTLSTYASSLASAPLGGNVENLLDASLTTRYPDPIERGRLIHSFMTTRGLPANLSGPIDIYAQTVQVEQSLSLTYLLTGVRNTVALSYYFQKREPVGWSESSDVVATLLAPANSQQGVSVQLSHRLTPLVSIDGLVRWSRLQGFNKSHDVVTNYSRELLYRAGLNWLLAPHTIGMMGLRLQEIHSNVVANANESAFFLGLDHRF